MATIRGATNPDQNRRLDAPAFPGKTDGQYDFNLDFKTGRQAVPDPNTSGDGQYNFQGAQGEKELLGQGAQASDEGIKDDEYPTGIPDPRLPGDMVPVQGNTYGGDVNFDSVAPYSYPEFPKDGFHTSLDEATGAVGGATTA